MLESAKNNLREWLKVSELQIGMRIAVPQASAVVCHGGKMADDNLLEAGAGDILWDEIVSIKKVGVEQVWDIEVEGTHNFVAGHLMRPAADLADRPSGKQSQWVPMSPEEEKKYLQDSKNNLHKKRNAFFGGIFAHNTYISGNLGIGDSATGAKLSVIGNAAIGYASGQTAPANGLIISGNVGIGTTGPGTTLDVNGIINAATGYRIANAATSTYYLRGNGTNFVSSAIQVSDLPAIAAAGGWTDDGSIVRLTTVGDAVSIGYADPGTAKLAINGNVGIGTTSPQAKFHVSATDNTDDLIYGLKLQNDGSGTDAGAVGTGVLFSAGSSAAARGKGGLVYAYPSAGGTWNRGNFYFLQNSAASTAIAGLSDAVMTIQNNGNVGIGTTNPGYLLTLSRSTNDYLSYAYNTSTGASAGGLNIRTDGTGNLLNLNSAGSDMYTFSATQATFNAPANFTSAGDTSIAYDLIFTNQTAEAIKSNGPLTIESGEIFESNDLTLRTYNSGGLVLDTPAGVTLSQAQAWTLATSATALNINSGLLNIDTTNSRVGIGTTSPTVNLNVYTASSTTEMRVQRGSNYLRLYNDGEPHIGSSSSLLYYDSGIHYFTGNIYSPSTLYGSNAASANLTLESTANSTKGYVILQPTGGNVGIGTTSPGQMLEISKITALGVATGIKLTMDAYPALMFNATGLAGGGRSIGTGKLVYNSVATGYGADSLTGAMILQGDNAVQFSTGGDNIRMTIGSTGNVGIGTTAPSEKLNINGNIKINNTDEANELTRISSGNMPLQPGGLSSSTGLVSGYGNGANGEGLILESGYADDAGGIKITDDGVVIWGSADEDLFRLVDEDSNAVRLTVNNDGYVGIGDTNPGYILTVNGQPGANGYTQFANYSDARLKENVAVLGDGYLDKIMQLIPSSFNYNSLTGYDEATRQRRINGFIAQQLQTVFPEMVGHTTINGADYLDTNLSSLPIYMVRAMQEQQSQILGISSGQVQLTTNDQQLTTDIAGLNLKTDQNITTLQGLQTSVDENLVAISNFQISISNEIQNQKTQITNLEGLAATLQTQIDELKKLNNQELNVAQIEANTIDIDYLKMLLGIDGTQNPGSVKLLGQLEADGVVAGVLTVKVSDVSRPTIGQNYIGAPKTDAEGNVIDDGRTYFVKTKAVSLASRVFVTPKDLTDQPIVVMEIKEGEGFTVAVKNVLSENLHFDWLIVNEAGGSTGSPQTPALPTAPEIPATTSPAVTTPDTTVPAATAPAPADTTLPVTDATTPATGGTAPAGGAAGI